MISRNDSCWCGSGKKYKKCHFPTPSKENLKEKYLKTFDIIIKTKEQILGIRKACLLAANILDELCKAAKIGVTTNELDLLSQKLHKKNNAIPAPLNYGTPPFPKTICTSLNEVICHGIPNDIPLKEGDILNIDVTTILDGFFGDCSKMVIIGKTSPEKQKLIEVTSECLEKAIKICKPNTKISEIGDVIENHANNFGFSVVNQFVGHGIGLSFHEPPQVPHHYNNMEIPMVEGMTFTIEPMINMGVREAVIDKRDRWTARTRDNKPSAQIEHTILITKTGAEALTKKS
jgi:methionyl aminopeptidase